MTFSILNFGRIRRIATATVYGLLFCTAPTFADRDYLDVSGYVVFDFNTFDGSLFTEQGIEGSSRGDLRNLKVALDSELLDNVDLELSLEHDSQEGGFEVEDFNLSIELHKRVDLLVGRFKEPGGLEVAESSRYQLMTERSPPTNALSFDRNNGVEFIFDFKRLDVELAAMKIEAEDNDFDDSIAYATRWTYSPFEGDSYFTHLGARWSTRGGTDEDYEIDENLIAQNTGDQIDSAKFDVDQLDAYGFELAGGVGPFLLQAETFTQRISPIDGTTPVELFGYYTTAAWTFMGDPRDYNDGEVDFDGDSDHTLELAVRFSNTDLVINSDGERGTTLGVALNYFARDRLRLSLEFQAAELEVLDLDDGELDLEKTDGRSVNARMMFSL